MLVRPLDNLSTAAWLRYLVAFAVASAASCAIILFYELRITNCSGYGYSPDSFLAQCSAATYGDYEHGGLGLQIERTAIEHLKAAQVVVLGHSHAMVGFSTRATHEYFQRKGVTFYNASLSGEYGAFYDFILEPLALEPRVLVIDVAPFFNGETMSLPGRFIVEHPLRAAIEYWIKHVWQTAHRFGCSAGGWTRSMLCGQTFATFRRSTDGSLIADYTRVYGAPLPEYPVRIYKTNQAEQRIGLARQFFSRHHLNAACTILTAVPFDIDYSEEAQAVAKALHARYVNPFIEHLTTVDKAHLNPASAEAWSKQFWMEADPVISRCIP